VLKVLPVVRQLLVFVVVGGLGFLVDAGALFGAVHLGAGPLLGRVCSISVTVPFTWVLNRWLTFRPSHGPSWREFTLYVVASLFGIGINYAVYSAAVLLRLPLLLSLAAGTMTGSLFNFLRYRALMRQGPVPPEARAQD
jgi:putative flippase GtrA